MADEATILAVTGAPVGFAGPVGIQCEIIAATMCLRSRTR